MSRSVSSLAFEALRVLTPRWIRKAVPWPLKWWLRAKCLGYTPYDFGGRRFEEIAGPLDVYDCYRLLLGRLSAVFRVDPCRFRRLHRAPPVSGRGAWKLG